MTYSVNSIPGSIGPYQVLKTLGEGGFGKVFLVEKEGQQFALKRFEGDFQKNETIQALFKKEFLFLKQYPHPNIVKVFDFGWDGNHPYFVSELIQGEAFDEAAKKATSQKIISWTFEILRALHFLHQHDLCHRDIKPDNILVTATGIKLIDFGLTGLAKGIPAGTPQFMAPELGREKYSPASDLYSLGVTLKKSLSEDSSPIFHQLIVSLTQATPSQRPTALQSLSLLFSLIPEKNLLQQLQKDLLQTLESPPYLDADGILQQILDLLEKKESLLIEIRGEKGSGKTRLLEELKPWLAVYQYEVALSDGSEKVLISFNLTSISAPTSSLLFTLKPWDSSTINRLLSRLFSFMPSPNDISLLLEKSGGNLARLLFLLKYLVKDEPAILFDEKLFSQQLAVPQLEIFSTESLLSKAEESLTLDRAKEAVNTLAQINMEKLNSAQKNKYLQLKAEAFLKTNQLNEALKIFRELEQTSEASSHPQLFERMGLVLLRYGNLKESAKMLERAISESKIIAEQIRRSNYLAQVFMKEGKHAEAEQLFLKNWSSYKEKLADKERASITNFNLTGLYLDTKQYDQLLSQGKEEINFYEKLNKGEAKARTLYNMGEAFYQLRNKDEAEILWKEGCEEAHCLRNQELLLRFQNALGNLAFENKKWAEAFGFYEKAFFYGYAMGEIPAICQILMNQGLIRKKERKEEQARALFEAARSYCEKLPENEEKQRLTKNLEQMNPRAGPSSKDPAANHGTLISERQRAIEGATRAPIIMTRIITYKKGDAMQNESNVAQAYRSLLHITELIGSERNSFEVLKLVLRYAIQLSGAERGAILLNEGDELNVACTQNADKEEILGQISQQIARKVLSGGEIIHTHDATSDQRFADNKSVILFHLRSILCAPIRALGKTVGVLYLDHTHSPKAFTDFDKEILNAYCQQVGIALENAKLFELHEEKERQLSEELESVREEKEQVSKELSSEKKQWIGKHNFASIYSQSPKIFRLFETLEPIIDTKLSVLIQGESGTGKELLAKAVHYNSSRKLKAFIAANCGAIPENLLESELFGYKMGAFTGATRDKKGLFEAANGGSLFLDEVGELSLPAQVKLLRVLQEGEVTPVGDTVTRKVDVRLIAATHQNLSQLIQEKKFREDLYYRLCEFRVALPSLRERIGDIPLLVDFFIDEYREENKVHKKIKVSPDLLRLLMEYAWPGNIRELRNAIRVGCALQKEGNIRPEYFPGGYPFLSLPNEFSQPPSTHDKKGIYNPSLTLEEHEKMIYAQAFKYFDFQPKKTYETLGISSATFFKKVKAWDLNNQKNRIYEQSAAYDPALSLQDHLNQILSSALDHYNQQPYQVIKHLKISPGYFYKWKGKK